MIDADCRVLSWNLWWRFGDWATRQSAIDAAIAASGADVIALQETYRSVRDDQPERLAQVAGLSHHAWSANRRSDLWRQRIIDSSGDLECGVALLSRWPIIDTVDRQLPAGDWQPDGRTALGVIIDHPRGPLPVVTTHLDPHPARSRLRVDQLRAVALLVHELSERCGDRSLAPVVCGDMNAEPESDEIRRLGGVLTGPFVEDAAFQDAWRFAAADSDRGWTWRKDNANVPPGNPNARIDYVFVGMAGRVASVQLIGTGADDITPSDHAGILADLRP